MERQIAAATSKPPTPAAKPPPAEAQLQQRLDSFLAAYCQAYGTRNLTKFKPFFTPKATENGTPVSDLIPTYSKLFASTEALTLQISPLRWHQPTPGQITLNGRFTIDLHYRDSGPVHGGGKIDFLLAWDDTSFQIEKMTYSFDK